MTDILSTANYWSYLFLLLAGACKGVSNLLLFHYSGSWFDKIDGDTNKYDPDKSYVNKHRDFGNSWVANTFEYLRKTAIVFSTDLWHVIEFFMIKFVFLAVITHHEYVWVDWVGVCMIYAGFWITFESKLLRT